MILQQLVVEVKLFKLKRKLLDEVGRLASGIVCGGLVGAGGG